MSNVNILILGDSHAGKLAYCLPDFFIEKVKNLSHTWSDHHFITEVYDYKKLDDGSMAHASIRDFLKIYKDVHYNIIISAHPGRSALNFDYDNFASGSQKFILENLDYEDQIVIPWFGYIDIRNWLPQKDLNNYIDAATVVSTYIDNTLSRYKKSKVVFMEPLPQFITFITNSWAEFRSDPDISFEDRYDQHMEFISELHKQCENRGLPKPINVREILGTDMIEPYMQNKKPINLYLNDHMKPEFYKKILNYIAFNIKKHC